jgi:hypothetical protein
MKLHSSRECGSLNLFAHAMVAIDGGRFKAVNSRDRSFSRGSIEHRIEQVETSIERYLSALETADRRPRSKPPRLRSGSG